MGSMATAFHGVAIATAGGSTLAKERRTELVQLLNQYPPLLDWVLPRIKKQVGKPSRKPETIVRMYGDQVDELLREFNPLQALPATYVPAQPCTSSPAAQQQQPQADDASGMDALLLLAAAAQAQESSPPPKSSNRKRTSDELGSSAEQRQRPASSSGRQSLPGEGGEQGDEPVIKAEQEVQQQCGPHSRETQRQRISEAGAHSPRCTGTGVGPQQEQAANVTLVMSTPTAELAPQQQEQQRLLVAATQPASLAVAAPSLQLASSAALSTPAGVDGPTWPAVVSTMVRELQLRDQQLAAKEQQQAVLQQQLWEAHQQIWALQSMLFKVTQAPAQIISLNGLRLL